MMHMYSFLILPSSRLTTQFLHVSVFGEAEFWLSLVKLVVMAMLILACLVISMGGQPSGESIGFKYWADPGAFGEYLVPGATGRLLGVWACMVQACFAYTGVFPSLCPSPCRCRASSDS